MPGENFSTGYSNLNIDKCFSNHYLVPDYQREYVWESNQVEQLINDLMEAYYNNNQKPYFMGMMVVYNGKKSTLEIVDGQQRITTFFILLCAIAHIYQEHNDSTSGVFENKIHSLKLDDDGSAKDTYVLELQYDKSTDCLDTIFHKQFPNEVDIEELSDSDKRLFNTYFVLKKELDNSFSNFDELKKFAAYILKRVEFVQIETEDISDALKIFETINERGVGLSPMDLLKNMIFMQVEKERFQDLNKQWKKIIEKLADINEKPLRFLRYFISATYDIVDSSSGTIKGILPEDKIYEWLTLNDFQCHYTTDPFGFVEVMLNSIERYTGFLKPNAFDLGNDYLRNIPRIAGSSYKLHLVLLLAASNMDAITLGRFKQILESIVYYAAVDKVKANETEKLFALWCPEIRKIKNTDDLTKFINEYVIPQVEKWKKNNDHHQSFMALGLHSMQQYRIKYILARIIKYVDDVRGGGTQYADISSCYDKKNQIEHIMPQTCENPLEYGVEIEEFNKYKSLLGNLTLLERTYNAACQNKAYKDKVCIYQNSGFYLTKAIQTLANAGVNTAANKMNENLCSWEEWNKSAIEERQEMLYKLSEMIWDIECIQNKW